MCKPFDGVRDDHQEGGDESIHLAGCLVRW